MLKGKCIVVGVCGGIAAYKAAYVVSGLKKLGAEVYVIMTEAAKHFVTALTFQTLSKNPVSCDMFCESVKWDVEHVELAKKADLFMVVPASANTIAKMANGIADNMLTSVFLATKADVLIAPAMNKNMYTNPATEENMKKLSERGCVFVDSEEGFLACGDVGIGRLAEPEKIIEAAVDMIAFDKDLRGLKVMVSAGATREAIDPVRFITNHSSGKMGYAIARAAKRRGADVTLVSGASALEDIDGVNMIKVESALEMREAIISRSANSDIIIKAAAVADYRVKDFSEQKIKKSDASLTLELTKNPDILAELGASKPEGQVLVGFCMETQNLIENAKAKLESKNCDFIVANNLFDKGAGFGTDTNTVTILGSNGQKRFIENISKDSLAHIILDEAKKRYNEKNTVLA